MSIQLDPQMSTSKWYLTLESNYKTPINMALSAQTPEQADIGNTSASTPSTDCPCNAEETLSSEVRHKLWQPGSLYCSVGTLTPGDRLSLRDTRQIMAHPGNQLRN